MRQINLTEHTVSQARPQSKKNLICASTDCRRNTPPSRFGNSFRKSVAGCVAAVLLFCSPCFASDLYRITYYCQGKCCCGPSACGLTASGKRVAPGMIACNFLPFNTKVVIDGKIYIVQDRGAKSLFGTKKNPIKHFDIFVPSHDTAKNLGERWTSCVKILA